MLIYDSHAHLKHGDAAATEYGADAIVEAMDAAGIEKSVVFAMSTSTDRSVEMARAAVEALPGRLVPYVYALPAYGKAVLPAIRWAVMELGFRGIKLHAAECRLTEYVVDPVFALAGQLGVPCLVDFSGDLAAAKRLATAFPRTSIIVAHLGQYLCTVPERLDGFIELAESCDNVYLDASGVALVWKIEDAARRVGSDRLLFDTDGPHPAPDTASFARREVRKFEVLNLTAAQKEDVFAGTLRRLAKIE